MLRCSESSYIPPNSSNMRYKHLHALSLTSQGRVFMAENIDENPSHFGQRFTLNKKFLRQLSLTGIFSSLLSFSLKSFAKKKILYISTLPFYLFLQAGCISRYFITWLSVEIFAKPNTSYKKNNLMLLTHDLSQIYQNRRVCPL